MILILLCFLPRVFSEQQHHDGSVSTKLRSSLITSEPYETGYVSSQADEIPGIFDLRIDQASESSFIQPTIESYSSPHPSAPIIEPIVVIQKPLSKKDLDLVQKTKVKYNPGLLSSNMKTDANYQLSKSTTHDALPFETETLFGYDNQYHVDDDDIRSSRGMHESWPLYYYNPNEYDHMKIDVEEEKAKDKRYAVDATRVIPIYEDLSDDTPYQQVPLLTTTEFYFTSTDNPMSGHDPFFSVMLNDYYNKNYDYGDQLTHKGIDWSNGETLNPEISRYRRLPNDNIANENNIESKRHDRHNELRSDIKGEIESEKEIAHKHKFNKHEKGDAAKANNRSKFHENEVKKIGFKDFVDNFANKFGSEDHKKDSKYIMKRNQDKGENRKGFRRVYHKDEYQEDNEFYDNNNSSVIAEDKGSSNANIGGSEGLLKSTSSANILDHENAYDKSGDTEKKIFENNHNGYDNGNIYNSQFHKYRDVAKQAAQSNDADYSIH